MSLNPQEMIRKIEFGTANLEERMEALKKLHEAGYPVGILVAPLMLLPGWREMYDGLFARMADALPPLLLKSVRFELIFMTYGFAHRQINSCAFPHVQEPFDAQLMAPCGRGRYGYKKSVKEEAALFFREKITHYFPESEIAYIV
jgi:spore photoproduct lyase